MERSTATSGTGPHKRFVPSPAPANDASHAPENICDQLRREHEQGLAELDALRDERDERRCMTRLAALRRAWVIHALAEETVVYRALEGVASTERADERFVEHELAGNLFEQLSRARPLTLEWKARLNVLGEVMRRHIESEEDELFARLEQRFAGKELADIGEQFRLAHDKLTLLESAKAA